MQSTPRRVSGVTAPGSHRDESPFEVACGGFDLAHRRRQRQQDAARLTRFEFQHSPAEGMAFDFAREASEGESNAVCTAGKLVPGRRVTTCTEFVAVQPASF